MLEFFVCGPIIWNSYTMILTPWTLTAHSDSRLKSH